MRREGLEERGEGKGGRREGLEERVRGRVGGGRVGGKG